MFHIIQTNAAFLVHREPSFSLGAGAKAKMFQGLETEKQ
jgi:hypothetical protein